MPPSLTALLTFCACHSNLDRNKQCCEYDMIT